MGNPKVRMRRSAVGGARAQGNGAVAAGAACVHRGFDIAGSLDSDSRTHGMQDVIEHQ